MDKKDYFVDEHLEDVIIGACISDDGLDVALECGLEESYFYFDRSKDVFKAMLKLRESGTHIDLLTLYQYYKEKGKGLVTYDYLAECTTQVYSAAHISDHVYCLAQLYLKRESATVGKELMNSVKEDRQNELLSKLQTLTETMMAKKYVKQVKDMEYFLERSKMEYDERIKLHDSGRLAGITTGLKELDGKLNGWHDSELIIVAGRPGMGKTAVAIHFALSAAKAGKHVCIFALEMKGEAVTNRMINAVSDINSDNFKSGVCTTEDANAFISAYGTLKKYPIHIDDNPVVTTNYIRANARRMKKNGQCDCVIIDYLQLIDMMSGAGKNLNREQQVAKASRELKLLAKELGCPVIVLSQLSRSVEARTSRRPVMSDLRDSGSIEQDADVVLLLYRPEYYGEDGGVTNDANGNFLFGTAEIIIAKQREGCTGTVNFEYNRSLTKIRDAGENVLETSTYDDRDIKLNQSLIIKTEENENLELPY